MVPARCPAYLGRILACRDFVQCQKTFPRPRVLMVKSKVTQKFGGLPPSFVVYGQHALSWVCFGAIFYYSKLLVSGWWRFTRIFFNQQLLKTIVGGGLAVAMPLIWLGRKPAQESVKKGMLGV